MRKIWFDFNAMNPTGMAWCSRQFCEGAGFGGFWDEGPIIGERVLLYDSDGNSCEGVIKSFDGEWGILVQTEISTWKDGVSIDE